MKITHEEAMRRAIRISHQAGKSNHPWTTQEDLLASAIEQAVRETAEECARLVESCNDDREPDMSSDQIARGIRTVFQTEAGKDAAGRNQPDQRSSGI